MIYYFGCSNDDIGHYLFGEGMQRVYNVTVGDGTIDWKELDGRFPPQTKPRQEEGVAALARHKGFTILAFWDRSKDTRYGSNAAFICPDVKEQMTFDAMVRRAREAYPAIWARFKFEVKFVGGEA